MKRKGNAFNVMAVIGVGFVMLAIPMLAEKGVDDFGVAGFRGISAVQEFPPWENQSDEFTDVNESGGVLTLAQGEITGIYRTVELTNEPDSFTLVSLNYTTSQITADNEINVTVQAYDSPDMSNLETESVILQNGTHSYELQRRVQGDNLKLVIELMRGNTNDPNPRLENLTVSAKSIDASPIAQVYQKVIMLAVIGFTVMTTVLILAI